MSKENAIKKYIVHGKLDMEKVVKDFYSYVLTIVRNTAKLSKEDEEELVSDVFL